MSSTANDRPLIGVTCGDPAGIGPEVSLQLAAVSHPSTPVLFGDASVLRAVAERLSLPLPPVVNSLPAARAASAHSPSVIFDLAAMRNDVVPGCVTSDTGAASYRYIESAIAAAVAGEVSAVTTGPIHKEALRAAGVPYPGHTEIFAALTASERACMMLTSGELSCSFVTTHVGYHEVPGLLSIQRIVDVIELTHDAMTRMRQRRPRLAICGLNPHAGENGLFGRSEEERFIMPAVQAARDKGIDIVGPLPPDTAFLPARRRTTDCFVCMYHDQGHIPLKALAFDVAVNTTLGLSIVRTSVDHGTALDIAWQGKADATSMMEAYRLAEQLSSRDIAPPEADLAPSPVACSTGETS